MFIIKKKKKTYLERGEELSVYLETLFLFLKLEKV